METNTEKQTNGGGKNINKRMFIFGLAGFLLLALVVFIGVVLFRVYKTQAMDGFTVGAAKVLNLPVAKVAGTSVSYYDYVRDMKAIERIRDYDTANNGALAGASDEVLSDQVLWRLAANAVVEKLAKEYGVKVAEEEIEEVKAEVLSQFENEEQISEELGNRYGWNLEEYINYVVKPYILQNNLSIEVSNDQAQREAIKNTANEVLEQIKNGADFEEMAAEYGEDGTAENGGDLGWFPRGVMVVPFEMAVFDLEAGELSNELIETQYGYHIIKVDDKRMSTSIDEEGNETEEEEVKARHILFRFPSLDTYLDNLTKDGQVHLYIDVHNPFVLEEAAE